MCKKNVCMCAVQNNFRGKTTFAYSEQNKYDEIYSKTKILSQPIKGAIISMKF